MQTLKVNGREHTVHADNAVPLLSVLRDDLQLTGAKHGCGEGECGACTVLLGSEAVRSCITPLGDVRGREVRTIEGLSQGEKLHRVQQAFLDAQAFQCGYCTPGMVMATVALLEKNPHPRVDDIKRGLHGNICRCGTYSRIVKAVQKAAQAQQA